MAQTWLSKYSTYEEEVTGSATGIIAFAGGGQASATELTSKFNSVDTCATDKDSVKLVVALIGKKQYVFNNTAKLLSVFPKTGEYINGVVDSEYFVLSGEVVMFQSVIGTKWIAKGQVNQETVYHAELSLSAAQIKTLNSVPVQIIAAPGVGKAIEVISGSVKYTFVSAAFTSTNLFLQTDTAASNQGVSGTDFTVGVSQFARVLQNVSVNTMVENKALKAQADADSAVGDGTAKIYITYRIITL